MILQTEKKFHRKHCSRNWIFFVGLVENKKVSRVIIVQSISMPQFIHLHNHYSLLDGAATPETLLKGTMPQQTV
jgi:hypothetical protein